jgi:hypothetical protein
VLWQKSLQRELRQQPGQAIQGLCLLERLRPWAEWPVLVEGQLAWAALVFLA